MDGNTLGLLADLLKEGDEEEDYGLDGGTQPSPYSGVNTPANIGTPATTNQSATVKDKGKEIWDTGEVGEGGEHDYDDARDVPEYEMLFKQSVGSEDVFLGLGTTTPLTSSCQELLVKIQLPTAKPSDIDLIITDTFLDCRTPTHRLGLHLPHRVDCDSSYAKWHSSKCVLEVSLKLIREYDFVN